MFFFGGFELIPLALVGLILLGILALSAGRAEPDPTGRRPYSIYLAAVVFVSLFTIVMSGFTTVRSLGGLIFNEADQGCFSRGFGQFCPGRTDTIGLETETFNGDADLDDAHIRDAVRSVLVALAAGAVLLFHSRRYRDLEAEDGFLSSPGARVALVYFYAVCFVAILTAVGALASATYAIFRVALPDVSGFGSTSAERDAGFVQLISSGALAAVAVGLFLYHWRRAEPLRGQTPIEASKS